jgi:hypothetical protein
MSEFSVTDEKIAHISDQFHVNKSQVDNEGEVDHRRQKHSPRKRRNGGTGMQTFCWATIER